MQGVSGKLWILMDARLGFLTQHIFMYGKETRLFKKIPTGHFDQQK